MSAEVRLELLGPVRAWRAGQEIDLGGARPRAVLALLALAGGRPVPRAELVDALWGERPPASAVNVIHTYLKQLRRRLEPDRPARAPSPLLPSIGDGYALPPSLVDLDVVRFRELTGAALDAQRSGHPDRAAALLAEALRLWHGPAVADGGLAGEHPTLVALRAERWAAAIRYGEALLATGAAAEALPVLEEAAAARPLEEAGHALLIRAYQAAGRRGQAFETYHAIRRRLAGELGVDPGPELVAAHAALLAEDRRQAAAAPPPAPPFVPAQLPAVTAAFTGRVDQLRALDKLLSRSPRSTVVISAIGGAAGIGKTTLALHWAHQVADRFPDGQLFVNLRGFDVSGSVTDPSQALRGFLEALQVSQIPVTLEAQVGLYRSLLAGRRMLVVLDNARDAEQVRPLLPGAPGCLVLVTSRNQLAGLVAADGALPLRLDVLPEDEARQLLAARLGTERVAAEPEAVVDLVAACAGLPLALAIVAARAAARPGFPLAAIAAEVRQAGVGLEPWSGPDAATDLRAVFSWSYEALDPAADLLFRLLGLHPGPDLSAPAAASLAAVPPARVRGLLAALTAASLLIEHCPGRWTLHDLVRTYAAELAGTVDSGADRLAAHHRLLDHYLHSARNAARRLDPHQVPITVDPPAAGAVPEEFADDPVSRAWFVREHRVLLAAVQLAARDGLHRHTWQLAWCMAVYLHTLGHWDDWAAVQSAALAAAIALGDREVEAHAHRRLAGPLFRLGRYDDAHAHLRRALELFDALGDRVGQAHTHLTSGRVLELQDRPADALVHTERALELFRAGDHVAGQARALNAVGWCHALLGAYDRAVTSCEEALALQQRIGDRIGLAHTWDSLGYSYYLLGRYDRALDCYRQSLELFRQLGNRYFEAVVLAYVGDVHDAAGDRAAGDLARQQGASIMEELNHPAADDIRNRTTGAG